MIIEFTGLPGVGKSRVISELIDQLKEKVVCDIPFFLFKIKKKNLLNIFLIDILIFFNLFKLKKNDYLFLLKSFKKIINDSNTFFHKINIFRNIIKSLIIFRLIEYNDEIFLLDEGTTHILFYLFSVNEKSDIICDYNSFYDLLPKPNKLIVVDEKDNVIVNRIKLRGPDSHRRIIFNDPNILNFVRSSRNIIEFVKRNNKNHLVYNNLNTDKINISLIKKEIFKKNV
jgi:thymidylate kinase